MSCSNDEIEMQWLATMCQQGNTSFRMLMLIFDVVVGVDDAGTVS